MRNAEDLCLAYYENSAAIGECGMRIAEHSCPAGDDNGMTCLQSYYEASRGTDRASEKDTEEWKNVLDCPDCLAVHEQVERRRELKKQRGILRREITKLGKRLKKAMPPEPQAEPKVAEATYDDCPW